MSGKLVRMSLLLLLPAIITTCSMAVVGGISPPASCDPSGWVHDEFYKGAVVQQRSSAKTPAACCAGCAATATCWSWALQYGKYCELLGRGDGSLAAKRGSNTTAGLKRPGPPGPPLPPAPGPPAPSPQPGPPPAPCPAPTVPPSPQSALPHSGNAYCRPDGTVTGLVQDGPASALQRCFYTAIDGTPAPGRKTHVSANESLFRAYHHAACGDTLLLDPEGEWDAFEFNKSCTNGTWIHIISAAVARLPPEGQRVTPCYAGLASLPGRPAYDCPSPQRYMPRIVFETAVQMAVSGSFIRFIGINLGAKEGSAPIHDYITTWGGQRIIFDRCWIRGEPDKESCCGIEAQQSNYTALIDSYSTDFHGLFDTCGDAQVYHSGTQGRGRSGVVTQNADNVHKVVNCYLEGSAQGVAFGGGGGHLPAYDIEVRRNHFYKPWSWNPSHPDFGGIKWATKTHLECKNCVRLLAEANLFENLWGGFGGGYGGRPVLLTPKNQAGHMPNATVTDVIIRYNWMRNVGGLVEIINGNEHCDLNHTGCKGSNCPFACPAHAGHTYSFHDIVVEKVSYPSCQGCAPDWVEITSSTNVSGFNVHDIKIDHITIVPSETSMNFTGGFFYFGGWAMNNVNWTNSILPTGRYPAHASRNGCGDHARTPKEHFDSCFPQHSFAGNLILAQQPQDRIRSRWPACNAFPPSSSALKMDPTTYALSSLSPYKGTATDGRDPGAGIAVLLAAISGVKEGTSKPPPTTLPL